VACGYRRSGNRAIRQVRDMDADGRGGRYPSDQPCSLVSGIDFCTAITFDVGHWSPPV